MPGIGFGTVGNQRTMAVVMTTNMDDQKFCDVCKLPVRDGWCSEYCAEVPEEKRLAFRTASLGDYIDYPCAECGAWIQDSYVPGGYCGQASCRAERFRRDVTEAKALLLLCRQHVPADLRALISDWMKNK